LVIQARKLAASVLSPPQLLSCQGLASTCLQVARQHMADQILAKAVMHGLFTTCYNPPELFSIYKSNINATDWQ
jgi:hypothetical protein